MTHLLYGGFFLFPLSSLSMWSLHTPSPGTQDPAISLLPVNRAAGFSIYQSGITWEQGYITSLGYVQTLPSLGPTRGQCLALQYKEKAREALPVEGLPGIQALSFP